jgi:hypothetical protein
MKKRDNMMITRVIALVFMALISQVSFGFEYTLEFNQEDIQTRIDGMLPVKKETFVAVVTLDQAKVRLLENTDQIGLDAKLFVNTIAGINAQGLVSLQGSVTYLSEQGAFYLHQAKITHLEIDKVPAEFLPQLKELAQSGLNQALNKRPIYVLKKDDMQHQLIKSSLKSIKISNQTLKATLGF